MINKTEFEIIKSLLTDPFIDENKFFDEIISLRKDKFIQYNVIGENTSAILYNGYKVTPQGIRAYEEYIAFKEAQNRETETLKIAREANDISKQANSLSENANSIASNSKTLSKWAVGISIAATLISIVDIIIRACT